MIPQFHVGYARTIPLHTHPCISQNRLGGGEGVEGLYGSITCTGTQKVLAAMSKHCGLDKDSVLVDIGAGLGR